MPELPEVEVHVARLRSRLVGQALERVRIRSFFLVRTFDPPVEGIPGKVGLAAFDFPGGKLLPDRSPARLLRDDWPKTLKELEERRR